MESGPPPRRHCGAGARQPHLAAAGVALSGAGRFEVFESGCQPAELLSDAEPLHWHLERPRTVYECRPVLHAGQGDDRDVLKVGKLHSELFPDHGGPLPDGWRRGTAQLHVVRLEDLIGAEESVLGGKDVPAVAGRLGVGGGFPEQLGDVELAGRGRALQLLGGEADRQALSGWNRASIQRRQSESRDSAAQGT